MHNISAPTDHHSGGLVSQMEAMNDSMNHHGNSSSLVNILNFDQHSIHHPVAGPSSGHSTLPRSAELKYQGKHHHVSACLCVCCSLLFYAEHMSAKREREGEREMQE